MASRILPAVQGANNCHGPVSATRRVGLLTLKGARLGRHIASIRGGVGSLRGSVPLCNYRVSSVGGRIGHGIMGILNKGADRTCESKDVEDSMFGSVCQRLGHRCNYMTSCGSVGEG